MSDVRLSGHSRLPKCEGETCTEPGCYRARFEHQGRFLVTIIGLGDSEMAEITCNGARTESQESGAVRDLDNDEKVGGGRPGVDKLWISYGEIEGGMDGLGNAGSGGEVTTDDDVELGRGRRRWGWGWRWVDQIM
jgi:hypothetical protein